MCTIVLRNLLIWIDIHWGLQKNAKSSFTQNDDFVPVDTGFYLPGPGPSIIKLFKIKPRKKISERGKRSKRRRRRKKRNGRRIMHSLEMVRFPSPNRIFMAIKHRSFASISTIPFELAIWRKIEALFRVLLLSFFIFFSFVLPLNSSSYLQQLSKKFCGVPSQLGRKTSMKFRGLRCVKTFFRFQNVCASF